MAVLTQHTLLAYYPYSDLVADTADILAAVSAVVHTSAAASAAASVADLEVANIHSALASRLGRLVGRIEEQN